MWRDSILKYDLNVLFPDVTRRRASNLGGESYRETRVLGDGHVSIGEPTPREVLPLHARVQCGILPS